MPEERFEEKTEPATPRKLEDARSEGNVSRSTDLNSAVLLMAAVVFLWFVGDTFIGENMALMRHLLERLHALDLSREGAVGELRRVMVFAGMIVLPLLVLMIVVAFLINVAQVGFLFTTKVFTPNPDKFNPITGMQRLLSVRGAVRALMGVLKLLVLGVVVGASLWAERGRLIGLAEAEFPAIVGTWGDLAWTISFRAALALLVLALLDYAYQRFQYHRDLRMSKQEVKEELKRYEGDPRIRERRRAIQRQTALQRMLGKVPTATVVITNPTHLAVALRYEPSETPAPTCVAKGAGTIAERIIELAHEHGVEVVRKPELARPLYQSVEPGQVIPEDLYKAVAEVIAYVYRLEKKALKASA